MAKGPHKKKRVGAMARLNRKLAEERAEAEKAYDNLLDKVISALDGKTVSLTGLSREERLRIIRGDK